MRIKALLIETRTAVGKRRAVWPTPLTSRWQRILLASSLPAWLAFTPQPVLAHDGVDGIQTAGSKVLDKTAVLSSGLARAISIASRRSAEFARYADGSHDRDGIDNNRIVTPTDDSELTRELLELVQDTDSYSEVILLARVAGQDLSRTPPSVPSQLSSDPSDPDWEFSGRNVDLPYKIQRELEAQRDARNIKVDRLTDTEFAHLEVEEHRLHLIRRREAADVLGWRFDPRDDLYVVVMNDGDIWRRKKPVGYVPSDVNEEPGSGPTDPDAVPEELTNFLPPRSLRAVFPGDSRELRSEFNGYNMQSSVWEPKGAIVDEDLTTQEVPVDVDCTGVKIRERLVVTAGHCQFKDGSWNDNRKWIPGADGIDAELNGTDPSPNGFKSSFARGVRGPWFDHEWNNYDFGLFILHDNASSCSLYWHGWRKRSGLLNDTIHLYGYPGETRDCDASPLPSGFCHGSIYGDDGSITPVLGACGTRSTLSPGRAAPAFMRSMAGIATCWVCIGGSGAARAMMVCGSTTAIAI